MGINDTMTVRKALQYASLFLVLAPLPLMAQASGGSIDFSGIHAFFQSIGMIALYVAASVCFLGALWQASLFFANHDVRHAVGGVIAVILGAIIIGYAKIWISTLTGQQL
jgi:hypothetical protein